MEEHDEVTGFYLYDGGIEEIYVAFTVQKTPYTAIHGEKSARRVAVNGGLVHNADLELGRPEQ